MRSSRCNSGQLCVLWGVLRDRLNDDLPTGIGSRITEPDSLQRNPLTFKDGQEQIGQGHFWRGMLSKQIQQVVQHFVIVAGNTTRNFFG